MHRGKVDPGVSEFPQGNELSRDHVNRPSVMAVFEMFETVLGEGSVMLHTLVDPFKIHTSFPK